MHVGGDDIETGARGGAGAATPQSAQGTTLMQIVRRPMTRHLDKDLDLDQDP